MPDLHFEVLRQPQKKLWNVLQEKAPLLRAGGFSLAGGTALALQLGHRESQDFDFFSQKSDVKAVRSWVDSLPNIIVREADAQTIHAEISDVKVSFIAGYRYPFLPPATTAGTIDMVNIMDIGLMKMLAITHRATLRDYLDLAIILRDRCTLQELIEKSSIKYGPSFNVMLCLRAMTHFDDLDQETPLILDASLKTSWQKILRGAVREITLQK